MEHHFYIIYSIGRVLLGWNMVGMFPPLYYVVDLDTSNGLMPVDGELMMLSRLLIVLL